MNLTEQERVAYGARVAAINRTKESDGLEHRTRVWFQKNPYRQASCYEVAVALCSHRGSMNVLLRKLHVAGFLDRVRRGVYQLAEQERL